MRRNRRRGLGRERFLMIASAVLVLGSLTATGLWLGRDKGGQDDGYVVDLSAIENNTAAGRAEEELSQTKDMEQEAVTADDLDYDPYFQETNSQKVENPDQSESESMSDGAEQQREEQRSAKIDNKQEEKQNSDETNATGETNEEAKETQQLIEEENTTALSTAMQPALTFSDSDTLVWPVVGNILVNYSMDKTVYFPTLQQYKYNPAIIIQANEGDLITAASAGKVTSVFSDPQIGNSVTMELGGGYEATYGQLANVLVSEGSYVAAGDVIAEVAAPTKYYSVEGTNVYFKLTKDGSPVNPLTKLN
ncbi:peptidoglycan DD-metalloendopeptidase family protein [Parablautia intestinalis]|uniref:peptidoglycan DD-metalloendopeptidase family protein n=1 Tax=Parablautia intestinalis TaxID=2320100 RepID=UPI00256EDC1A|nr:peptidoglycan DD-metalloendopeptidase family protein [Parablautia intestinalis]